MAITTATKRPKDPAAYAIANEVLAWMGRRRIRQSQLARMLGENETWLSTRLHAITPLDSVDMTRIARALGVKLVDLLPLSEREVTREYVAGRSGAVAWPEHPVPAAAVRLARPPSQRRVDPARQDS